MSWWRNDGLDEEKKQVPYQYVYYAFSIVEIFLKRKFKKPSKNNYLIWMLQLLSHGLFRSFSLRCFSSLPLPVQGSRCHIRTSVTPVLVVCFFFFFEILP